MFSKLKQRFSPAKDDGDEYISEESAEHGHDPHGGAHRPRNLGVKEALFHLDADWGTSLAYVLPIALSLAGRLAPIYMLIIATIMFVVANGYKIVCRHNPDGGGVYSSLKKVNKFLAVVGALLLVTDYLVTIALSVSDSYHYLRIDAGLLQSISPTFWTVVIIIFLGIINWFGPHFTAKFAGIASASTFILAGLLAILALPLVPQGLANIGHFNQSIFEVLRNTTGVLLALSGVEAISNMTGIMKDPERTSKRALNIELVKVIFTTVVLGIAMNGLPDNVVYNHVPVASNNAAFTAEAPIQTEEHEIFDLGCVVNTVSAKLSNTNFKCPTRTVQVAREDMLAAMGEYLVPGNLGVVYGALIGFAYGLLLMFAGNTALIDITNVTYALARDGELPGVFTKLNKKFGVPIAGLVTATIVPIIIVLIVGANIGALAALYAIGVASAVTLNLAGTTLQVVGKEKIITGIGAVMMGVLLVTLIVNKMEATIFAGIVLVIGLTARAIQKKLVAKPRTDAVSLNA
jgi:amino acid transporter